LQVIAIGGVNARNKQGQVRANRVEWGNSRVLASGGVTLLKDGHTLSGARLESDQKFDNATLTGNVRGTWAAGGTVESGVLRKNGDKIVAGNGVRARYDTLRLQAGRLDSTTSGHNILVSQSVELRSADGATVRAPQLRYDKRQDKVFGQGGVSYTDPARGLNLKGKTLVVSHVTDPKRREAVLTAVQGSGNKNSLEDLKLF
jgi:lipopolysaccharide assembly outer membrane protein LptD (OstA)